MKRRLIFPVVAVAVAASLVVTPAIAAQTPEQIDQSVATYDQLVEIVNSRVEDAYASVNSTVESMVAETVKATIGNPQAILDLATPLIKSTAKGVIAQYIQDERLDALIDSAVDAVAESQLVNSILTNEFVLAVIARTVDYAVADIVAALGLAADQQATADSIVNQVWNAPLVSVGTAPTKVKSNLGSPIYALGVGVNTSYYNYNVTAWNQKRVVIVNVNDTPREITVTGWNSGNIGLLASGTAVINAGSKADSVVETLSNLDYVSILIDAGWRALQDEIQIRIDAAILAAKTALLEQLQTGLAGIGVQVTLDPASSWTAISAQIAAALRAASQEALQAALDQLPWVATPGTPDEGFFAALSRLAGDGASYLLNWFLHIDWLKLFRGGEAGPAQPTLSIKIDRKAMTNTDNPVITVDARDAFGAPSPAFAVSFSYGDSCQFPSGQEPSRRTCQVTATFGELTAKAQVEVFDPSALAAPVQGLAVPGETLKAAPPAGWPTTTRVWTRNGTKFSTASSYKLPSTEKIGNVIELTTSMTYQGLTISASSPALTVGVGAPASLTITPKAKAITNAGGADFTVVVKDAKGNVIPEGAQGATLTYSLAEGCAFPTGQAPSRRTCLVTASYGGVTGQAQVEVFDPSALAASVQGLAVPGSTLKASPPEGWPTTTRSWIRNGTKFSTASSYKLPSTEKIGNTIVLTTTMTYQGLTISATSPVLTVGLGAPATLTITPKAKAITNAGGADFTVVVKDSYGNVIPAGATGATLTYSLDQGCAFPTGQAPSRRTCLVTASYGGATGQAQVEVFDPSALAAPVQGVATPGSTLKASAPEGWPTTTRRWTRNGTLFSTASSYKLPSAEKAGNVIVLTTTMTYQGLTISGTAPALTVTR